MANIIGPLLFMIMSVGFFSLGAYYLMYQDYAIANGWKGVSGTVANSSLITVVDNTEGMMYQPNILYDYSFGGKSYSGYCCSIRSVSTDFVEPIVSRNPAGSEVDLLVNPDDPFQSRIREDVNPFDLFKVLFTGFSGLMLLFSIWWLAQSLKPETTEKEKQKI